MMNKKFLASLIVQLMRVFRIMYQDLAIPFQAGSARRSKNFHNLKMKFSQTI